MSLAIVYSRASCGISAPLVTVETHLSPGLPRFNIVGLPETAVQESKDRVRSALMYAHFEFPPRRITVNLAPADLPKEGGRFDLPIALGVLAATSQIPLQSLAEYELTGELALSGEIRAVRGVLPMVLNAHHAKRSLIVPSSNAEEAALVPEASVFSANHLLAVCAHLRGETLLPRCELRESEIVPENRLDLADVRGQIHPKRALEIAAAGKHSLLFIGPPGTGKTMLSSRLAGLLPPLSIEQALEVAAVASVSSNGFESSQWRALPFRSPHHSSSSVALVGGGRPPRPGEISLAHHGILFLDELPEFNRKVLESVREPLESGSITISRAAFQTVFPARFQLIAAMNPCPCGYAGSPKNNCRCTRDQVTRYLGKLSGPLMDRIDMQVEVPTLSPDVLTLSENHVGESTETVRKRVEAAREQQEQRQGKYNADLTPRELNQHGYLEAESIELLNKIMIKYDLSARTYHRIVKVARTIADLAGSREILMAHLSEAITYRALDKLKGG